MENQYGRTEHSTEMVGGGVFDGMVQVAVCPKEEKASRITDRCGISQCELLHSYSKLAMCHGFKYILQHYGSLHT